MKGNKLKILACFCAAGIACAGFTACGEKKDPLDAKHGIADQSKLYGMCYLLEERDAASLDIRSEVALMKNLGVKTVRQWMHFTHFMSAPDTLKPNCDTTAKMHELLAACEDAGMTNIGMNHHNFCTTQSKPSTTAKPFARDVSEGSEYVQWLNDYYTSWKTLVAEFPEVLYWEVDNEVNNPDFMTEGGTKGQSSYNLRQMAAIATDMFYYATRAIHEVNPAAQSVMGGLTEPTGLGNGNTATYWGGYYGGYAITKGAKDPYKALDLLEYLTSPEGSMLRLYGIEGTHYTLGENGEIVANLEGRNAERSSFFSEVTEADGTLTLSGLHKIGSLFGYNVDWDYFEESGKIAIATDIGALYPKYRELVSQAIEYTKDLQTPKLLNVTAFPATIDTRKTECMKISSQFINRAIVGTLNLTSDWNAMLADMDKAGYATVKAVMKETVQSLGII